MKRSLPSLLVAVMALAPLASPTALAGSVTFHVPVASAEWVAFRFNVTPGNDLVLSGSLHSCHNRTSSDYRATLGDLIFAIRDGSTSLFVEELDTGHMAWAPGGDTVHAGVSGHAVREPQAVNALAPTVVTNVGCDTTSLFIGGAGKTTSLTYVIMQFAPRGFVELSASWTTGVLSHDVVTGNGTAITKAEFERGAGAMAYSPGPSVAAAALAGQSFTATRDAVSWFVPEPASGPELSLSSCHQDGAPCSPRDSAGRWILSGDGGACWQYRLDANVGVDELPKYVAGMLEFPDDSFMT